MTRSLATSPDGQWAVAREGRELFLFANADGEPVARLVLDSDDVDVALVGPPTSLVVVNRERGRALVTLYQPPTFEITARLDLDDARVVAITGPRLALLSPDAKTLVVVRTAGRGLASQKLDTTGPIEFVVGLERNQLLLGLLKKMEVWDAVSGRPLLRPQFQLPPPPRLLGTSAGHMWAMRQNSDEIFVYRLSDGRPFRHHAGSQIRDVIAHPSSPVILLVTQGGLVRLNCFAHSLQLVDSVPPEPGALAQLVVGDDVMVIGYVGGGLPPWRALMSGPPPATTTTEAAVAATATPAAPARVEVVRSDKKWREPLVAFANQILKGNADVEVPALGLDTELGDLAHRLRLTPSARRGLIALYAVHLIGEPALSIARLGDVIKDWSEALGQGDLGALAMIKKKRSKVRLRRAVTDVCDGVAPRHVRLIGQAASPPRPGAFRVARDGRADAQIEADLVSQLGRIAMVDGSLSAGMLEARLHGATAVTTVLPEERPSPWPRDAGLVLVLYGTASAWVADVPALTSSSPTAS